MLTVNSHNFSSEKGDKNLFITTTEYCICERVLLKQVIYSFRVVSAGKMPEDSIWKSGNYCPQKYHTLNSPQGFFLRPTKIDIHNSLMLLLLKEKKILR